MAGAIILALSIIVLVGLIGFGVALGITRGEPSKRERRAIEAAGVAARRVANLLGVSEAEARGMLVDEVQREDRISGNAREASQVDWDELATRLIAAN
ncbi:hypothetical protein [Agromyces sp. NPDC058104]|uniref:hypothetical protein n=1 Tax=Agromyces sp. NPDC058104 TaxID=3346342 RepID=UPI0036D7772B